MMENTHVKKGIGQVKVGDSFNGFLLIKQMSKGVASNGKPFLTLIFGDQTGEIEAKLWDASNDDEQDYQSETIVKVSGEVTQYRNKKQLKIFSMRLATRTDGVHLADFIEKAPVDDDMLREKISEAIFEMENPNIQRLVRAFVRTYDDQLFTYPAASKNHHAYVAGLAHHIVGMLHIARSLCEWYPQLNKDLLYAGVILHDIGKIKELSGVMATSYTLEGKLIGHIPMMVEELGQMAKELQIEGEEVLILQHMVLSHHGKAEWGSPTPPLVQEAEILHYIDQLDAKLNMLGRALSNVEPGDFTERIFPLENRSFYKPNFTSKE